MTDIDPKPLDKAIKEIEELQQRVFVGDTSIVIKYGDSPQDELHYDVPLEQCDNLHKILHWVWHLAGKTWMTNAMLKRFIEVATARIEVDPTQR